MRLGPDFLADVANVPLGWNDGEYVRDEDGNVTFVDPDQSELGSIAVRNLVVGTVYAALVDLDLADGQLVAMFGPPLPIPLSQSGLQICSFTAHVDVIGLGFRGVGAGTGVLGRIELREVLEA